MDWFLPRCDAIFIDTSGEWNWMNRSFRVVGEAPRFISAIYSRAHCPVHGSQLRCTGQYPPVYTAARKEVFVWMNRGRRMD